MIKCDDDRVSLENSSMRIISLTEENGLALDRSEGGRMGILYNPRIKDQYHFHY